MKLEKLTEDKIRVILSLEDLEKENLTLNDFVSNEQSFYNLFAEMLEKAEKELGFITKDCKLLIEAFSSPDDFFVFTITKYTHSSHTSANNKRKILSVRKKTNLLAQDNKIYTFNNFEDFCLLCTAINSANIIDEKEKIAKNISLYLYNNTYYLLLNNINVKNKNLRKFYSYVVEFSKPIIYSKHLEARLTEYGKIIIKKNALSVGINFFGTLKN